MMNRRSFLRVGATASLALAGFVRFTERSSAADLPEGVPVGSAKATVIGHIDGDKYAVSISGSNETVLMISANAPEEGDCFYKASADRLKSTIPVDTVVYLEHDGEAKDGKDRLLRYTWLPRDGKKAMLVDERMIADGYSTFKAREGHSSRDARLQKAQNIATSKKRGLWADGACEPKVEPTEPPKLGSKGDPAPIGTTLTTDGQEITVTNAYFSYDFGFVAPKGGYVFLVVESAIKNIDDSGHGYAEDRFTAEDMQSGADFETTFTLADSPLGYGDLSPQEYVSGQVVLEVQESSTQVRIKYDAKTIGGGEVYWGISR
jgi:endonuclease YncB( thermonuclease family)